MQGHFGAKYRRIDSYHYTIIMHDEFCQSLGALSDNIEMVLVLDEDGIVAHYSKQPTEAVPFLTHSTASIKSAILRMQIFASIMNEDNVVHNSAGSLRYSKVSRSSADQFFFPLGARKTLVVVAKGRYDESSLVDMILTSLDGQAQ